jgi:hypothetical protein
MAKRFYSPDLAELHNSHYAEFVEHAAPGAIAELRRAGIQCGQMLDLGCGGGQRYSSSRRIAKYSSPKNQFDADRG